MKKILLFLSLILTGSAVSYADPVTFYIDIDDASHVTAVETWYDNDTYTTQENPIQLVSGQNTLSIDNNYHTVQITAVDGFFITSCVRQSTGAANYISSKTSTSITVSSYDNIEGETFVIVTKPEAESRTASVTVNIDEPEAIQMMRYQINGFVTFTEPSTVVRYDPADELPLQFGTKDYQKKIYKITVSEGTVEEMYGTWRVTPADGAVIDIQVAFPDKDVTYTLESSTGEFGFLTVKAGSPLQPVDISSGSYTVKAGTSVEYSYDTQNYKIMAMQINGVENSSALYSYSFTASDDATHSFTVRRYEPFNATVHVNFPDKARVYKGSSYGTLMEGTDGVFTIPMQEPYDNQLTVMPEQGYYIENVTIDPADENLSFSKNNFSYTCYNAACDIQVTLAEVLYDHKTALFIDNAEALSYFGSMNAFDGANVFPEPQTGYNVYDVSLAGSPASISGYINEPAGPVTNVYHNHLAVEKQSEWSTSYSVYYTGNDVVHVYVDGLPTAATLSFDIEDGVGVEAMHNKVVPVTDFAETLDLFKGDEVAVKVNLPADEYEVLVNDAVSEPDAECAHVFSLADDSTVVKVSRKSALAGIVADDAADAPVYNLQGIRVDRDRLVPGIYVSGGKKFRVK